jgi:CO/xanthine dehydrogenase Mo-binding subunit
LRLIRESRPGGPEGIFDELPGVRVQLIDCDSRPLSVGEAFQSPTGVAIANAIGRALGAQKVSICSTPKRFD